MNRTSIATLTLRLAALYFWLQAILSCTAALMILAIAREQNVTFGLGTFGGIAVNAVAGALLWIAGGRWADRMLGAGNAEPIRTAEIGTLAFRLVGIWLLVFAVREVGEVFAIPAPQTGILAARVSAPVVKLALGLVLLLAGPALSRRWFPDGESPRATPSALQPIAFSVLGLVVLANALPVVLSSLVSRAGWFEDDGGEISTGASSTPRLVAAVLRVVIGLWLFFGPGSLARFWRWVQTAGLDRQTVSRT